MDQDLDMDEADAAATLHARVRIASSAPTKAPHRPQHLPPADADMDVLSLVRPVPSLPSPLPSFLSNAVLYPTPQHRVHAEDQHDSAYARRMKRWASEEGATGRGGSGRGGGRSTGTGVGAGAGAAVTGHRPRAANNNKKSSASSSSSSTTAANSKAKQAAPAAAAPGLRKTASVLSAVADRRGRFGT